MPSTDMSDMNGVGFRCVNCGWSIERLYMQYSPGNIRLLKCDNCKAVADPYIECEFMIVFIDLILHKTKAFRHLLFNVLNLEKIDLKAIVLKSGLLYFILDVLSLSMRSKDTRKSSRSSLELTWIWLKVLLNVLLGNFVFACAFWIGARILLKLINFTFRYREVFLAVFVSSYFRLSLLAMMVWDFPFASIIMVDIIVLSLNSVALRVLTQMRSSACIVVCLSAHGAKIVASQWMLHVL